MGNTFNSNFLLGTFCGKSVQVSIAQNDKNQRNYQLNKNGKQIYDTEDISKNGLDNNFPMFYLSTVPHES